MGKQKAIIQCLKTGLALNPCLCSVLLKKTNKQKLSFNKLFYLFIFGCAGSLLLHGLFSSCGQQSGEQASHSSGSSGCGAPARGSVVMVHRLSCSMTCGIFPDQESNLCLLLRQVDSLPLSYQGSPI